MKNFHVHLKVTDLAQSITFYTTLFGAGPTVAKDDYAKWMLDDPRVNFAISTTAGAPGIEHLGIQVEHTEELAETHKRMTAARGEVFREGHTTCCYAKSEKSWITDPQGVSWEAFHTYGEATVYGEGFDDTRRNGAGQLVGEFRSASANPKGKCC
jgi:catechol 2,3-dioxygenase-like lactoylglutathione lyase family enzyme